MSGFLDKKTRIIDMVLTDYGRELFSKGKLNFNYYAFSDDEVDYDPFISNSSSLTQTELTSSKVEQIENSLVREAVFGLPKCQDREANDYTNIHNLIFTMPQGQKILPEVKFSPDFSTGSLVTKQQKIQDLYITYDEKGNVITKEGPFDIGFKKFLGEKKVVEFDISDYFLKSTREGNIIKVFISSSDGLIEVDSKFDLENISSYTNDLKIMKDDEIDDLNNKTESYKLSLLKGIISTDGIK